jgi:hypothetical protein
MTKFGTIMRSGFHRSGLVLLFLTAVLPLHAADEEITPEELIARHLESIGPSEARQQIQTRRYVGEGMWRMVLGGVGQMAGHVSFDSSGDTCDFTFGGAGNQAFTGERFRYDGKDADVKRSFQEQYSVLGQFMRRNRNILGEGLFGGTANLSWALLDTATRKARMKYLGLKVIEGRRLHALDYRPRKRKGETTIELYFDPETYRHVRTEYRERFIGDIGPGRDPNQLTVPNAPSDPAIAMLEESQVSFVETFEEFHPADGVMVPALWTLKLDVYNEGRGSGSANVSEIKVGFQRGEHNGPLGDEPSDSIK